MTEQREIMTWEMFGTASRAVAQAVADDGYDPDMVLAIARGGLLIGGALGYALAVKNVYTMNVEFYTGPFQTAMRATESTSAWRFLGSCRRRLTSSIAPTREYWWSTTSPTPGTP